MKGLTNWRFWQRTATGPLPEQVRRKLAAERGVDSQTALSLRMVEQRGKYAGRKVTFFRVFDPGALARAGIEVREFSDLDGRRHLQLHAGHIEGNGQVELNK